jgi:hypothetical protein
MNLVGVVKKFRRFGKEILKTFWIFNFIIIIAYTF